MEKKTTEHHFQEIKQEQMRHLLDSLNVQERMRIDNMIDRHAQEMLQLIDKKARLEPPRNLKLRIIPCKQEVSFIVHFCLHKRTKFFFQVRKRLPPPNPPRKKKHELYSDPQVFDEIDFHAIQVKTRKLLNNFLTATFEVTQINISFCCFQQI